MDAASQTGEAPLRAKITFHGEAFGLWVKGLSHRAIAAQLGIKTARVSAWAAREKWTQRLQEIGKRLAKKAMRQAVESLQETRARHARIARRGLTRVERKLMAPFLEARDIADLGRAMQTFGQVELERHPDFIADPARVVFPEMAMVLEQIWDARRATTQQAALCAPHNRALQPHDSQGRDDGSQRTLGLSPLALPRGVDPREAYCAEREAEDALRADSDDQGAHAASVTAPPLGNLGPGLPPCPPVSSSRRVGQ